jgi:NADPH2:quinone reductase
MLAAQCSEFSDTDFCIKFVQKTPPLLKAGAVRIKVKAAGINFADLLIMQGRYQVKINPPFIPGFEISGIILEVAQDVKNLYCGQYVMAVLDQGGFAEEVVVSAQDVFPIPSTMNLVYAAGFPIVWGTAYHALKFRAELKAHQTILINGAAGGVGQTAISVAKALGAIVIATAGSDEKVEAVMARGAHFGFNTEKGDFRSTIFEVTQGKGVDLIFDPVGGEIFENSLRSLKQGGKALIIGFASGVYPKISANILLVKNHSIIGYYWGAWRELDPESLFETFRTLSIWYDSGLIPDEKPSIIPFKDIRQALTNLRERRIVGKQVLLISEDNF